MPDTEFSKLSATPRTAFFTIASWNYLHYARTLAASLVEDHSDIARFIAVADTRRHDLGKDDFPEFDDCILFDELDVQDRRAFSFRYDILELNTAIKPSVFLRLFAQGYDRVIYLDPDIVAYRRFDEVIGALDAGASTVLTPHSLAPILHRDGPNDLTFMQAGVYNLGFMALAKTPDTLRLLKWWETRLQTECVTSRVQDGIFVDQKFVDLWPAYCPDTHILRNPAYNVAYWNLDTRTITKQDGSIRVEGVPLAFFHFSGIVPGNRAVLSKHQTRRSLGRFAVLLELFNDYHDRLERYGLNRFSAIPYGFQSFTDGTEIPRSARILFRERLEPFHGDPFRDLPARLNGHANLQPNPGGVVSQLAHALWTTRADLQSHFDLRSSASQLRYADWYVFGGADASGISDDLVRPAKERLAAFRAEAAHDNPHAGTLSGGVARWGYRLLMRLQPRIRWLYQPLPLALRRRVLDALLRRAWPATQEDLTQRSLQPGISLIGYPFAEMGVGQALRSMALAVETGGFACDVVNFDAPVRSRQKDLTLSARVTETPDKQINVFCVNADMLGATMRGVGPAVTKNRYNIIRPFWELPRINPGWVEYLNQVDEIWAPTAFVRDAFAAATDRPVTHIPVAISVPENIHSDRERFRIPRDAMTFLFAFDFSSHPTRKNPAAVLEAYSRAFGDDRQHPVTLIVKTMGQNARKAEVLDKIRTMARADSRIIVIDDVLSRQDMYSLTASCDVFVSLHRSEGFGLGIAEAMAMGKAVIATDFSGSTDFVSKATGYPVAFRLIEVKEDDYPYFVEGQKWAEPDIAEAANIMRLVGGDREQARKMGKAAKAYMNEFHSPERVGRLIADRVKQIGGLQKIGMPR